jgi:hypothetical protein
VDDNDFVNKVYECEATQEVEEINIEKDILDLYFKKGSLKPRHRQLSHIKNELSDYDFKTVSKSIHKLEKDGYIQLNGDLSFLTRTGIAYYNDKYRTV